MELGLEDVAHFRGCYMYMYVQASMELHTYLVGWTHSVHLKG